METVCVGIDTGGTFTDLVAVELERGRHHYHKVPTLTADPAKGILDGIVELLDRTGLDRAAVKLLVLGTIHGPPLERKAKIRRLWQITVVCSHPFGLVSRRIGRRP
jgi:predicted NBD/HSP70 family sugar kinase